MLDGFWKAWSVEDTGVRGCEELPGHGGTRGLGAKAPPRRVRTGLPRLPIGGGCAGLLRASHRGGRGSLGEMQGEYWSQAL